MTHRSHALVEHRLGGDPGDRLLTGGLACYGVYPTADGRRLTVAALEPRFFATVCEVLGRPELAERQYGGDQEALAQELTAAFAERSLTEWLERFDGEDACVGPVSTRAEAAAEFGFRRPAAEDVPLGTHTAAWRAEVVLEPLAQAERRREARRGPSIRSASSGYSPSRSSRIARMPSARAPSMSSAYESPTITASGGATSSAASAASKIDACGFVRPWLSRADGDVDVEVVVAGELDEVALTVRDQPELEPAAAQVGEHRQGVVVEVEVVVHLPAAHHVDRACPRGAGVPAHAAHDVLGEGDPDLLVVHELGVRLQDLERREARVLVAGGIER